MTRAPTRPTLVPADDASTVHGTAHTLTALGYHVTPLAPNSKAAILRNFPQQLLTADDLPKYFPPGSTYNVGLLLGTEVADGVFVFAVDVDEANDPQLISRVRCALGGDPPGKRGAKGATYIAACSSALRIKPLKRKDMAGLQYTAVDFMGVGGQIAIPPSIHPDTRRPYEWLGRPLPDVPPDRLFMCRPSVFDEIKCAVDAPDSPLFLLNDMAWYGPGKGGSVDDATRSATAAMVARGWEDGDICARVALAVRQCLLRCDYDVREKWSDDVHNKRVETLIEDARKKGFDKRKTRKQSRSDLRIAAAERIVTYYGGLELLWRHGTLLRRYQDGYWQEIDVERMINHVLLDNREWAQYDDAKAVALLVRGWAAWYDKLPARAICLENGTLHLDTNELKEWSLADRLTARVPIAYDQWARACPHYEDLLLSVFDMHGQDGRPTVHEVEEDTRRAVGVFEEFWALSLVYDLTYQKMLVVRGPTGSGKSTLAALMRSMHDPMVVGSVPVNRLHEERYLSSLDGKLLNISAEVNADSFVDDEILKNITGGDSLPVRRLYAEVEYRVLPTRLAMFCNKMFRTRDTSGALERRLLLLDCGRKLEEKERDRFIGDKIRQEMPAVLNRLVEAYTALRGRGFFDPPSNMKEIVAGFTEANNHVRQWLQEQTHQGAKMLDPSYVPPDGALNKLMPIDALYGPYHEWAIPNGYKAFNKHNFAAALTEIGFPVVVTKMGGKSYRMRRLSLTKPPNF